MEREIKFQYGFESVNGIIKKVYYLSQIPTIKDRCDVWNVLPICYVRQFTGLKDNNGVDIYLDDLYKDEEGDIFKVIQMQSGTFALEMLSNNYIDECIEWNEVEIIGNIHENPELLC